MTDRNAVLAAAAGRVAVLGAGVSGVAAARLARALGGAALVLDEAPAPADPAVPRVLRECGAGYRSGGGPLPAGPFSLCVASPAFAPEHRWLAACRARGVPVVRCSRVGAGPVIRNANFDDDACGSIAADDQNPPRVRLLAALALTRTQDVHELQRMFDRY